MKKRISIANNTFGHIYTKVFQNQLVQLGRNLCEIRESRNETVETVARALNLVPGIIIDIENGSRDFKVTELFDLCDHYETAVEDVVKNSGMIQIKMV